MSDETFFEDLRIIMRQIDPGITCPECKNPSGVTKEKIKAIQRMSDLAGIKKGEEKLPCVKCNKNTIPIW